MLFIPPSHFVQRMYSSLLLGQVSHLLEMLEDALLDPLLVPWDVRVRSGVHSEGVRWEE